MLRGFQEKVSDMPQWVCDMTQFFEVFFKVVIHRNLNSDKLRKNLLCWTTVWMQSRWVNSFIVKPTYRNLKVGLPNSRRPNRRCFACPSHRDVVNVENTGAFSTKKSIQKKRPRMPLASCAPSFLSGVVGRDFLSLRQRAASMSHP